ncbi:signal recognition particle 14 kDa protein-like [Dysidea avara]|uniref:signal recognition particle 14 kDa protein-like n=1 Tax=Dysidea avara TaxID=196820 RepID=UPI00331BE1A4
MLLDNDSFLTELGKLFGKTKHLGSVTLTMKKYNGRTRPCPRDKTRVQYLSEPEENLCLLRASNGKKNISTVISNREVTRFQMAYANVLKANMDALKKREKRVKTQKTKATH